MSQPSVNDLGPTGLTPEILDAALLATRAHAGQVRKGNGNPYIYHPLRVAKTVAELPIEDAARHRSMILAALLHDVLEDTDVPPTEIAVFGADVLTLVEELTQEMHLPRDERKRKMIAHLPSISDDAKVIKLADRLDNVSEMGDMPDDFVARYTGETRRLLEQLEGSCPELERAIEGILGRFAE